MRSLFFAALLALVAAPSAAVTQIELWHALGGPAGDHLNELAGRFNASQNEYAVVPVFKGGIKETFQAALAAQRSGKGPHVVHVDETLMQAALDAGKAFRPVYQVMQEARTPVDTKSWLPAVSERFSDEGGRLLSLPLNPATPVLFYNRDIFQASGLDPDDPPRTWLKLQEAALALMDAGHVNCAYTTESPAWIHVENLLARHNEPLSERRPAQERLVFTGRLMMRHVGLLSSWVKSGLFTYYGRGREGAQKFAEGECAMLTGASSSYTEIMQKAQFRLGVSPLPFHDDFPGAPFGTLVGGGSLWVMAGKKPAEYRGIAKFFAFLSQPEVQAQWHQATAFIPAIADAFEITNRRGFYDHNPGVDVSVRQVHGRMLKRSSHRRSAASWLRGVADEELEAVWLQRKTPKEAVDAMVERGNRLLQAMNGRASRRR